uniref:Uncharacterized protein n=1 Tax=Glossina palpalis gambiensis TaxID=67801 RepID=A0A1B0BTN9_9MUSC
MAFSQNLNCLNQAKALFYWSSEVHIHRQMPPAIYDISNHVVTRYQVYGCPYGVHCLVELLNVAVKPHTYGMRMNCDWAVETINKQIVRDKRVEESISEEVDFFGFEEGVLDEAAPVIEDVRRGIIEMNSNADTSTDGTGASRTLF